jgi:hypothetical protein
MKGIISLFPLLMFSSAVNSITPSCLKTYILSCCKPPVAGAPPAAVKFNCTQGNGMVVSKVELRARSSSISGELVGSGGDAPPPDPIIENCAVVKQLGFYLACCPKGVRLESVVLSSLRSRTNVASD